MALISSLFYPAGSVGDTWMRRMQCNSPIMHEALNHQVNTTYKNHCNTRDHRGLWKEQELPTQLSCPYRMP